MAKTSTLSFAFLSEILSSPRLKPFTLRLHPSTVMKALKGVFDDASQELWSVVSEQRRPDFNELIEKVVGRLSELVEISEPLVIDARGRLFANSRERLALVAKEEGAWIVSESQSDVSRRQDAQREKEALARLARLAECEAAAVFPNTETARAAVLQTLVDSNRSLVVARRDMCERENGERLEDAFDFFSELKRKEIGACNAVKLEDYAKAIDASTGLVWRTFGRWSPEGQRVSAKDVATLKGTNNRSFSLLGDLEFAPLLDLSEYFDGAIPTISERLKNGFDLILCDGAQLIGGPNCGLLFGSRATISKIVEAPVARLSKLDRVSFAILAKTLSLYETRATAMETIPILRLLSTSQGNLTNRAERLAALLETLDGIQIARAIDGRSALCVNASFGSSPTKLVEAKPRGCSPADLARRLESGSPRLLVRWTRDAILLDVKTLAPEQDSVVVEALENAFAPSPSLVALTSTEPR